MASTVPDDLLSYSTLEPTEETALVDALRARDNGMTFREAAAAFKTWIEHFQALGHNLYGRTLLGPTDAEAPVACPCEDREREMIVLASNNYLGLTTHPKVIEAARAAALSYGTGAGSAPLLIGTFPVTKALEAKLAEFKSTEDACILPTGYAANVGVISAVAGKHDVVILDRLAHASMVDGARMSGATTKVFRHNDAVHLDRVLARCRGADVKLVAVEGLYSMDGDIALLDQIHEVTKRHNALLLVDEAHSTGVLGPEGRGAAAYFGLEGKIDFHVGTLSKALGSCGGFVAGDADLVNYIRYYARSGMFSTAPSPMVLAAADAALDVVREEPQRRERLWENARFMHSELKRMGFRINESPSPIIPVIVGSMKILREMTLELHRANVCVNSVPYPAVPLGSERLRISLTANHTRQQLERALECLEHAGRRILPGGTPGE